MTGRIRGYYAKLFPFYPIQVVSPKKANIKIASRKIYVDFPHVYWQFMWGVIPVLARAKSPQEEFKKEWKHFTSDEDIRKIAFFNNKPLGSVSLVFTQLSSKLLLKLKVNWQLFFDYLDDKAQRLISEIEKDGSSIREVYNEILANYYRMAPHIVPEPTGIRFNPYTLESFKKLLRKSREEEDIHYFLKILLQTVEEIEKRINLKSGKRKKESHPVELWTLQLKSDIYGIEECLENMDILACYLYLRNLLENFIKFVIYNRIAENFKHDGYYESLLHIFFFYEKISQGGSCYSIQELVDKYGKALASILRNNVREADWEGKVFEEMHKKQLPKLRISRDTLNDFRKIFGINLSNYWSACSEILHNQSPFPFFSLLEIKAFKYFLSKYVEYFTLSSTQIFKIDEESIKTKQIQKPSKEKIILSTRAKKVLHDLSLKKEEEVMNIISSIISDKNLQKEAFFDPLTLLSLFHLFSPEWTQINSGEFDVEDVEYLTKKVEPLSFKGEGIKYELDTTFERFQEKMKLKLEQSSKEFSKLNEEEKNAVIFSLLVIKLPQLIKEKSVLIK